MRISVYLNGRLSARFLSKGSRPKKLADDFAIKKYLVVKEQGRSTSSGSVTGDNF